MINNNNKPEFQASKGLPSGGGWVLQACLPDDGDDTDYDNDDVDYDDGDF